MYVEEEAVTSEHSFKAWQKDLVKMYHIPEGHPALTAPMPVWLKDYAMQTIQARIHIFDAFATYRKLADWLNTTRVDYKKC